jgi:hypothetical protein
MGDFAEDLINGSMEQDWRPKNTKAWADMTQEEQDSCIGLGFPTVDSSSKPKGKLIYTLQVVDSNGVVHWENDIEGARGTKHARDLWRVQYPEVRKSFIGRSGFMAKVKTRRG